MLIKRYASLTRLIGGEKGKADNSNDDYHERLNDNGDTRQQ
jgi:hypothetical protein